MCFRLFGIIKGHPPEGKRCPWVMDHREQKSVERVIGQKGPDGAADFRRPTGSAAGELGTGLLKS